MSTDMTTPAPTADAPHTPDASERPSSLLQADAEALPAAQATHDEPDDLSPEEQLRLALEAVREGRFTGKEMRALANARLTLDVEATLPTPERAAKAVEALARPLFERTAPARLTDGPQRAAAGGACVSPIAERALRLETVIQAAERLGDHDPEAERAEVARLAAEAFALEPASSKRSKADITSRIANERAQARHARTQADMAGFLGALQAEAAALVETAAQAAQARRDPALPSVALTADEQEARRLVSLADPAWTQVLETRSLADAVRRNTAAMEANTLPTPAAMLDRLRETRDPYLQAELEARLSRAQVPGVRAQVAAIREARVPAAVRVAEEVDRIWITRLLDQVGTLTFQLAVLAKAGTPPPSRLVAEERGQARAQETDGYRKFADRAWRPLFEAEAAARFTQATRARR